MTFPVDFFEHNQQLTEVEFGGNDLLQVYNGQQIKHRLNSTGMYVANTKVQCFSNIQLCSYSVCKVPENFKKALSKPHSTVHSESTEKNKQYSRHIIVRLS